MTHWGKLADRDSIPGHNERFALVKLTHDFAATIAELALGDLSGHTATVALVLQFRPATVPSGPAGFRRHVLENWLLDYGDSSDGYAQTPRTLNYRRVRDRLAGTWGGALKLPEIHS